MTQKKAVRKQSLVGLNGNAEEAFFTDVKTQWTSRQCRSSLKTEIRFQINLLVILLEFFLTLEIR